MKKNGIQHKIIVFFIVMVITVGVIPSGAVQVKAAGNASEPAIGQISLFPFNSAPEGWMECDGRSLSVSEYTQLYASIGNAFGGNYVSFNLPDLSESAPITGTKYYIAVNGIWGIDNSDAALGEVCLFADITVESYETTKWMLCDGTTLSSSTYNPLYSLISTTYGGTSAAFKVPNLTSKSPINGLHYYIATIGIYPTADGIWTENYIGGIELYAFSFIPYGTYNCNGQSIIRIQNQALFGLFGYTFGGSGSSFSIPNLSSAVPSFKMRYCMRSSGLYPSL